MTTSPGPSASRQGESSCKRILFMQKSILCSLMQKKYDRWHRRAVLHHSRRRRGQWPFLMHCLVGLCLVLWPQKVWYSFVLYFGLEILFWYFHVLFFSSWKSSGLSTSQNSPIFLNHRLPQNYNEHFKSSGGSHSPLHRATLYSLPFRLGPRGTVSSFIFETFCLYFSTPNNEEKKTQKASLPHFW